MGGDRTCGYVQTESGNRPGAESPTIYGSVGPSAQAGVTPRARPYAAPPPGTRIQSPNHSPFGGIPDEVMGGVDTCPPYTTLCTTCLPRRDSRAVPLLRARACCAPSGPGDSAAPMGSGDLGMWGNRHLWHDCRKQYHC